MVSQTKSINILAQLIEKVKKYLRAVTRGIASQEARQCRWCKTIGVGFTIHDRRKRIFLVISAGYVHKVIGVLLRCRCKQCGRTFTVYPDFALPYKRYLKDQILQISYDYLTQVSHSYRRCVQEDGMPIGYAGETDSIDERQLSGSTVYRWIGYMGSLKKTLREVLGLIRERDPGSDFFRKIEPVHANKYRSPQRKYQLQRCMKLFQAENEFKRLFKVSVFPRLVVVHG